MNPEQKIYKSIGVSKEDKNTNPFALAVMVGLAEIYAKRSNLIVKGLPIPHQGPGIFTGTHVSSSDVLKMIYTARNFTRTEDGQPVLGRQILAAAKHTLLEPFSKEREDVLEETGKTDWLNSDALLAKVVKALTISPFLRSSGFYPIHRGEADKRALEYLSNHLSKGGLAGISLSPTRIRNGTIRNIKPGSAFLAIKNPDVPIYFVAVSKEPNLIAIGGGLSYNGISSTKGKLKLRELALEFADCTAKIAIPGVQEDWASNRETELQKLFQKKTTTLSK